MNFTDDQDNQYLIPHLPEGFDPKNVERQLIRVVNGKLPKQAISRFHVVVCDKGFSIIVHSVDEQDIEKYWATLIPDHRNEILIQAPSFTADYDEMNEAHYEMLMTDSNFKKCVDVDTFVPMLRKKHQEIRNDIAYQHHMVLLSFPEEFQLSKDLMGRTDEDNSNRQAMDYIDTCGLQDRQYRGWFFNK